MTAIREDSTDYRTLSDRLGSLQPVSDWEVQRAQRFIATHCDADDTATLLDMLDIRRRVA